MTRRLPHSEIYTGDNSPLLFDRLQALGREAPDTRLHLNELMDLAIRGLPAMRKGRSFVHTLRQIDTAGGRSMRQEGDNLRYTAKMALGLACTDEATQRQVLGGDMAADVAMASIARAEKVDDDPGAVALAAWAAAEAADFYAPSLFSRLEEHLASDKPIATVSCGWTLLAALAARHLANTRKVTLLAKSRLMAAQGPGGLFPHLLPGVANGRLRAHVGSFADQVYPIQSLARFSVAESDPAALSAAEAGAARICALQGSAGQWWWHYDSRNASVVEGYPVYSVHQYGMGPMALLDLHEAGGTDYMRSIVRGLRWLDARPESDAPMVADNADVVWRKIGRHEPRKATRAIQAVTTAMRPGFHLPMLDVVFPPGKVDHECRPYEFGWMLYAWLSGGIVESLRPQRPNAARA